MKKITLLIVVIIAITASFATTTRWYWYGDTPQIATTQYWDMGTTPNWYDPTTVDPLIPFIVPDNFVSGKTAILDESAVAGSDTLKVNGLFNVDSLIVNNTRTYVLRSKTGYTADSITGNIFVKDGSGNLVMDCKNKIVGGTILKNGKLLPEKTTSPNIFGSKLTFMGGTLNFNTSTTTAPTTYPVLSVPIEIPTGVTARIELSRYSFCTSTISGAGDLEIATAGERTELDSKKDGGNGINWKNFTGNLTLKPYKITGVTVGYYGLLLSSKKTFDISNISTANTSVDSIFWNKKITLKSNAGFSSSSGTRCWMIGELQAENDSCFLSGYGAGTPSTTPAIYYMIGSLNTDVTCPITIKDQGTGTNAGKNKVGVIKTGTGKYIFTSTKSICSTSLGVQVNQGTFLVNIPLTYPATTTALGRNKTSNILNIKPNAIGGGNGRLTGIVNVDSLGTLVVGCDGMGQLELADTLSGTVACPLKVSHYGSVIMKVASKSSHDLITSTNAVTFNGGTLSVKGINASINNGDTITLISYKKAASSKDSINFISEGLPAGLSYSLKTDTVKTVTTTILKSVLTGLDSIKTTTTYTYKVDLIAKTISALNTVSNSTISVFPNPAKGEVNFSSNDAEINSVEIFNLQGQCVYNKSAHSTNLTINLNTFSPGVYTTRVKSGKETKIQKLIVQ